jgi:hypothetical protein
MAKPHLQPVTDRSAWRGEDLAKRPGEWTYRLTDSDVREIDAALAAVRASGKPAVALSSGDFPLAALAGTFKRIGKEVNEGQGFFLIKGLPIERYSAEDAELLIAGVGSHFGRSISQNAFGDIIGHVRDIGAKLGQKDVRGYDTNSELRFHNDECDLITLLCLRQARSGGLSSIVSSAQMFNELLATRPETLPQLFEGYIFSLMGEHRPGVSPVSDHKIPIFSWHAGRMSCRYTINTVLQASHYTGQALSEEERSTLFAPLEAARLPGMALRFDLEPGDLQIANNLSTLHQRTEYVDFEEPEKKRHLLRLWLASNQPRPLAPEFEDRFNGWSFRKGIPVTRTRVEPSRAPQTA